MDFLGFDNRNFSDDSEISRNEQSGSVFRGWEYAKSGDYHKQLDPNWSYTPTYLKKMQYIRHFLEQLPKDQPILDAGCGEGVLVLVVYMSQAPFKAIQETKVGYEKSILEK